ncbi:MAG: hypothetical protein J6K74_07760 [Marinifilaceae bacterium]|nr:hypothetical protein [Marinifilaceae bacterium]
MTKLTKNQTSSNIPAGIFDGIELFAQNGKMFAIDNGTVMPFDDLPESIKKEFWWIFSLDTTARSFLKKELFITDEDAQFTQWLFCKFGSCDGTPDFIDGAINTDAFNSACKRRKCPGRGKICGCISSLKDYEVETLALLISGHTLSTMSSELLRSVDAIKSRIEKLKSKLKCRNVAQLASIITSLGIDIDFFNR